MHRSGQSPWVRSTLGADGEGFRGARTESRTRGGSNPQYVMPQLDRASMRQMMPRGSMVFRDGDLNTKTGRIERWVGLDRRAHRYLCYSMSFLIVMMIILIGIGFGFAIFPLLFSLFLCLIGCVGWRCVLPDTNNENGGS